MATAFPLVRVVVVVEYDCVSHTTRILAFHFWDNSGYYALYMVDDVLRMLRYRVHTF